MSLRMVLFSSMIGIGCSWFGATTANAQVFYARGVRVVAVVQIDTEPKTAASELAKRELQYYESSNRLYAARQQYWLNQRAAYQYIEAQRQWQAQQNALWNNRQAKRLPVKKFAQRP